MKELVEVVCTHGENGGGPVGEENSRIQCMRCEFERKTKNGMDGCCEKSVQLKRNICKAMKDDCA